MRAETQPWWRQAEADLETAWVNWQHGRFYAASWFVQQAVEKGLKALYMERTGALAARTHDLTYLAAEVSTPPLLDADLTLINPTFDLVRYPGPGGGIAPVDLITEQRAAEHVEAARRVFSWLSQELSRTLS